MPRIMNLELLNPFKTLKCLECYFVNITQIHSDFKLKVEFWILNTVIVMKGSQTLFFYVIPLSLWTRILLIDYAVYFNMPLSLNLLFLPIPCMFLIYFRMLYYDNNNIVTDMIKEVVIEQNNRFFLYESVDNIEMSDLVRKYTWIALMANQPTIIIIGKVS